MSAAKPNIVIIGAGLAGLACARILAKAGVQFTVLEAADAVGGRVRSDRTDGYILDRGFQVLLPHYPEARRVLDYDGLNLKPLYRGTDIFFNGRFHRLADPFTHPVEAMKQFSNELTGWRDKWFTLLLRKEVFGLRKIPHEAKEEETEDYLRHFGFTEEFIERFFRPFFGGIFLEKDLRTSSLMFRFLFAMFDRGGAAVPAHGMQAIPEQLAVALPPQSLRLNTAVTSVRAGEITLASGEVLHPDHIILAVPEEVACRLLPDCASDKLLPGRSTTCLYFSSDEPIPGDPILFLDGEGRGPVNNACVLSNVAPSYAPAGKHLISTSIVGAPSSSELEGVVREQMVRWFGPAALKWEHLRTYQIRQAQPESRQLHLVGGSLKTQLAPGLYRCGDYCENVSINGALVSGRHAAESVLGALA